MSTGNALADQYRAARGLATYGPKRPTVHLIAVGDYPAKPAGLFEPGDHMAWNYGTTTTVASVAKVSAAFVLVTFTDGTDRRIKASRLVAFASRPNPYR